jgi:RimJ/RimL family protein N-acetyltransferase
MIIELAKKDYGNIRPLLKNYNLETHPVINGVIDGNNSGKIFVDDYEEATSVLVWAKMEMFYLIGGADNETFNSSIESFIVKKVKPEALSIGDTDFNLETFPSEAWEPILEKNFHTVLYNGFRVPFIFNEGLFIKNQNKPNEFVAGYEVHPINREVMALDKEGIIQNEILKFWESLDLFYEKGIGYGVTYHNQVIGTCISVFVAKNEYEIGINTYSTQHRGKGIATRMARDFIKECLARGVTPHWTTEDFRKDSIAIAEKMGFIQQPHYKVHYIPFEEWVI